MSSQDVINSVRIHKAMDAVIEEYGCTVNKTDLHQRQVITKGKELVGYVKSYYLNDYLTPKLYMASKWKKKLEGMYIALALLNIEIDIVSTNKVTKEIKDWVKYNIWKI